jgi:hypothetical protein
MARARRGRNGSKMSKDYRAYAAKAPTPTMVAFAEWLKAETGVDVDLKSVALAGSLRMDFQKSDFWKNHDSNYLANVEANRAERAKAQLAKAEEAERKAAERASKARAKAEAALAAANAASEAATAKNATPATVAKSANAKAAAK